MNEFIMLGSFFGLAIVWYVDELIRAKYNKRGKE